MGAQAIDRAGQCELRRPQSGHEVAAPHLTSLLQGLEHRIHPGEPSLDALGESGLAGEHAVALEELQCGGVRGLGGGRRGKGERSHQ